MSRPPLDHCADCASTAVGLDDAGLRAAARAAVADCARLDRPQRKGGYPGRLRVNVKRPAGRLGALPRTEELVP